MAAWANLSAMTIFSLRNNNITGTLPDELATAWPNLTRILLGQNRLVGKVLGLMHGAARV